MPRVPPNFRRSDLQRAIRGAREEGFAIERIEVAKDGGFTLHPASSKLPTSRTPPSKHGRARLRNCRRNQKRNRFPVNRKPTGKGNR